MQPDIFPFKIKRMQRSVQAAMYPVILIAVLVFSAIASFAADQTPAYRLLIPNGKFPPQLIKKQNFLNHRFTDNFNFYSVPGNGYSEPDFFGLAGRFQPEPFGNSFYGSYFFENFYLDAIIGSSGRNDSARVHRLHPNVFGTGINRPDYGDAVADEYTVSVGAGYTFNRDGISFGPYARAKYLKSEIDEFPEIIGIPNSDPGLGLALELQDQNIESFSTSVGGQIAYAISTTMGVLTPYLRMEWEHEFEDDPRKIQGRFADSLDDPEADQVNIIIIPTDDPDRDFFNLGLGFSALFQHGVLAFVDYETILGLEDINGHKISAGLKFEF